MAFMQQIQELCEYYDNLEKVEEMKKKKDDLKKEIDLIINEKANLIDKIPPDSILNLECVICHSYMYNFENEFCALPCGHIYCISCTKNIKRISSLCGTCRTLFHAIPQKLFQIHALAEKSKLYEIIQKE
jgi:late competence protein required for DNA uptake (superfamily II DNA/RNA helicase)